MMITNVKNQLLELWEKLPLCLVVKVARRSSEFSEEFACQIAVIHVDGELAKVWELLEGGDECGFAHAEADA